ncbi:unnamed protein product, partial [Tetraodon nigroviridis]
GEKNNGFDVLYHNMKHGQISSKELTDFIRERSTIEETYARSMTKLAKTAGNFSQLGTFAPVWEVFKGSTERLASCHMELVRKLQELIKDVQKYVEEQAKAHKKTKEEVAPTLEAVQNIQTTIQALQKSKEIYNSKTVEQERLRKEGATQREVDKKFQDIEESHFLHMKDMIHSYSQSVEETHIQIVEVQNEFMRNIVNTSAESLIQKLAESKGTGKERPGQGGNLNGRVEILQSLVSHRSVVFVSLTFFPPHAKDNSFYSSSDSEDEEEPRKFHVEIKPVQPNNGTHQSRATIDELKASIGNIILSPSASVQLIAPNAEISTHRPVAVLIGSLADLIFLSTLEGNIISTSVLFSVPISVLYVHKSYRGKCGETSLMMSLRNPEVQRPMNWPTTTFSLWTHLARPSGAAPLTRLPHQQLTRRRNRNRLLLGQRPSSPKKSLLHPHPLPGTRPMTLSKRSGQQQRGPRAPPSLSRASQSTPSTAKRPPTLQKAWTPSPLCAGPRASGSLSVITSHQLATRPQRRTRAGLSPAPADRTAPFPTALRAAMAKCRAAKRTAPPVSLMSLLGFQTRQQQPPLQANYQVVRPFSPPKTTNASPPPTAPLARAESSSSLSSNASLSAGSTPTVGTSRGPSPVTLASQDALPIAVAFTESVNAYFKGADPTKKLTPTLVVFNRCIVKITGEMTLSFPMGIIKVFTNNPSPAVLTFRLKNTSRLEQVLPNQQLLYSDPSQSDSNSKDFWFNMQALTSYLRKASDQNPSASYYNVDILKYQVQSDGIHSTPLNLTVYWKCAPSTSDLRIDYRYNPDSMANPGMLTNVQILVPVDGGVTSMQSLPPSIWNSEQSKCLWKLSDISEKSENEGKLAAKFELSNGPSNPSTLAVQFFNEGTTLSGIDMELQGSGYRLSLNKKRFATGTRPLSSHRRAEDNSLDVKAPAGAETGASWPLEDSAAVGFSAPTPPVVGPRREAPSSLRRFRLPSIWSSGIISRLLCKQQDEPLSFAAFSSLASSVTTQRAGLRLWKVKGRPIRGELTCPRSLFSLFPLE